MRFKLRYIIAPRGEHWEVLKRQKYSSFSLVIASYTKRSTAVAVAVLLNAVRTEEVDAEDEYISDSPSGG